MKKQKAEDRPVIALRPTPDYIEVRERRGRLMRWLQEHSDDIQRDLGWNADLVRTVLRDLGTQI